MAQAIDVANCILSFANLIDEEERDLITNLKMQKLVYYCQGFALAILGRPLFNEDIEAWEHGPVCPSLYHEYKKYKSNPIPYNVETVGDKLSEEELFVIKDVYEVYGQFSAWKLRDTTHEEEPWKSTKLKSIITKDKMKEFFKTRLIED